VTDEEYFTIKMGPLSINMFNVFVFSLLSSLAFGFYRYYTSKPDTSCPIELDHKALARQKGKDFYKK
jgi:hypothetical protein